MKSSMDHVKLCLLKKINIKKLENTSIDLFLTNVKEVVDFLEEVGIDLLEDVIVYSIINNLLINMRFQKNNIKYR